MHTRSLTYVSHLASSSFESDTCCMCGDVVCPAALMPPGGAAPYATAGTSTKSKRECAVISLTSPVSNVGLLPVGSRLVSMSAAAS
jgi:hypothetical protein